MKKIKKFFSALLLGSTLFLICTTFFILYTISKAPSLDIEKLYTKNTTKIFDCNDNLITTLGAKKSEWVNYDEISKNMINAIICIEDERFFEHNGIDNKRIFSATIKNIFSLEFKEGASTINQQLIKNVFLTNEKKLSRKIKEIYLSLKLDQKLSKNQILECYLNNILYGKQIYGIKQASKTYFHKNPSDLTISEAAFLAGMIQMPNYYNPYINPTKCQERRNLVLEQMYKKKYINSYELEKYKNINILDEIKELHSDNEFSIYSSYVSYCIYEARNKYGYDPYLGGIDIYTNYDPNISHYINEVMKSDTINTNIELGIVAMDKMGKIEGIGGSREKNVMGINYALVKHQPGSTIKPLLDYAPAIEYLGYGSGTLINDEKMSYKNGFPIRNWDLLYKGNITIRQSLVESRNIPAIKLFNEVGYERCYEMAKKMGLNPEECIYESNAIGGYDNGYSVLEMTNAYQALANNGIFIKGYAIREIKGEINVKYKSESNVAMSYETAYIINDILKDIGNRSSYIDGLNICAKTGQTNFDLDTINKYKIPSNATKDSWYIGYNPDKIIGVWTGFSKLNSNNYFDNITKNIARDTFKSLMKKYASFNNNSFYCPSTLVRVKINKKSGLLATQDTSYKDIGIEIFKKGTEPKS